MTNGISPEAQAVNAAREKLAKAMKEAGIEDYLDRERLLEAIEHFINAKIRVA